MGYPSYLDPNPMFGEDVYDFEFPLVGEGVLSGKSKKHENLIISSPVFYGNSGGAVLYKRMNLKRNDSTISIEFSFHVIGVVSSFIPFVFKDKSKILNRENYDVSNSGYTVVVPLKFALELIEKKW